MATKVRVERIAISIQKEISDILKYSVRDSRVQSGFSSVTRVHLTNDLRHAKVFISVYGDDATKAAFMDGLHSAQGFIRSELAQRMSLRFVPELHFLLDSSIEEGAKVLDLLEKLRAKGELGRE